MITFSHVHIQRSLGKRRRKLARAWAKPGPGLAWCRTQQTVDFERLGAFLPARPLAVKHSDVFPPESQIRSLSDPLRPSWYEDQHGQSKSHEQGVYGFSTLQAVFDLLQRPPSSLWWKYLHIADLAQSFAIWRFAMLAHSPAIIDLHVNDKAILAIVR